MIEFKLVEHFLSAAPPTYLLSETFYLSSEISYPVHALDAFFLHCRVPVSGLSNTGKRSIFIY